MTKKKPLTEKQKLAKAQKAAERKIRSAQEAAEKKKRDQSRTLMIMAMGAVLFATILIIVAGTINNAYSNLLELFAYGITAAGGFALILSSKYLEGSSKRWILIAGFVAILMGLLSFVMQSIGIGS